MEAAKGTGLTLNAHLGQRDDANARLYGRQVSVGDIFAGSVGLPPAAQPLLQTLYAAEGRPQVMGTHAIPQGQTPGDLPVSEEELKSYEAQAAQGGSTVAATGDADSKQTAALQEASGSDHFASQSGPSSDALPPSYDEVTPDYGSAVDPFGDSHQPRDAAAEKEALRAKYAQEANTSTSHPTRVEAMYDFAGSEAGDLAFKVGQVIEVTGTEGDQWYRGRLTSPDGAVSQGSEFRR